MSQFALSQMVGPEAADFNWNGLYPIGAAVALLSVAAALLDLIRSCASASQSVPGRGLSSKR